MRNITIRKRWLCNLSMFCLALLLSLQSALGNPRATELILCLQDFDGIEWKLPYRPTVQIRSCATPEIMGNSTTKLAVGSRRIEITADLTLGSEAEQLSFDESYAALQLALFTHFDALIRQRGYQLVNSEMGNSRTEVSPHTQCMMRRRARVNGISNKEPCPEDSPQAAQPAIPYINLAHYERQEGVQTITLVYKLELANLWSISIEGLPAKTGAR